MGGLEYAFAEIIKCCVSRLLQTNPVDHWCLWTLERSDIESFRNNIASKVFEVEHFNELSS